MSDQPTQTPLLELARSVPKDLRAEWETQWFENGAPCGHAMAPVGKYLHDMADEIERLRAAARKTLKEQDESDEHHSAACMNWSFLEHSQHQCGLCDLREALKGVDDATD